MDSVTPFNRHTLITRLTWISAIMLTSLSAQGHAEHFTGHGRLCPSIHQVVQIIHGSRLWHAPQGWSVATKAGSAPQDFYSHYAPHFAQVYLTPIKHSPYPKKVFCEYDGGQTDRIQFVISRELPVLPAGMTCNTFGRFTCNSGYTGFLPTEWLRQYNGTYYCIGDKAYNCPWQI